MFAAACGRFMLPAQSSAAPGRAGGFTLVELLAVVAVVMVLAAMLLPALARAKGTTQSRVCLSNLRQLTLACLVYAGDHGDALPYNMGEDEIRRRVARGEYWNWSSSIMSWEADPQNIDTGLVTQGGLGPYAGRAARIYRCPSDTVVSDLQARAGWSERARSISMNAMAGDAGEYSRLGWNTNNPNYRQFFLLESIPRPAGIFLFIEEHPDSINDGYFLNRPESGEWTDLPASYHQGAANLSYADGHVAPWTWRCASTLRPNRPDGARLPFAPPPGEERDFRWLMSQTTVEEY